MTKIPISFGTLVRLLREQKKLSITELASKASVSRNYLSQLERDVPREYSLSILLSLGDQLDITAMELGMTYMLCKRGAEINIHLPVREREEE
jgi:transcriptional regulator with XRE-family HTH domain